MSQIETETSDTHVSLAQIWKDECIKNINDLNKQTALYWSLTINLATRADSKNIRGQLRQARGKAIELATLGGYKQCPNNKRFLKDCISSQEYERIGSLLASVIEFLITLLRKNLQLQENSYLNKVKINSGLNTYKVKADRLRSSSSIFTGSHSGSNSGSYDSEVPFLLRHIRELQCLVDRIYESSDFKPWEMEPHTLMQQLADNSNPVLARDAEQGEIFVTATTPKLLHSRKCKFLLVLSLIGLAILITLLSTTLVVFS